MKPILGFAEPTALQTLKLVFERQPTAVFQKPIFIGKIGLKPCPSRTALYSNLMQIQLILF